MEIQQTDKNELSNLKVKEKLNEKQIKEKSILVLQKIKTNIETLTRFIHDLEPHLSKDFQKALKSICSQYSYFLNYNVSNEVRTNLRLSIANELISSGGIDVLVIILPQLLDGIDLKSTEEIDKTIYDSIKNVMTIFFNYSDASKSFGEEVCNKDKLLSLYNKILVNLQEACINNNLTKSYTEILRITIATLYNTLLYDSENNLQKIRQLKFLDIIKHFLDCKIERIKISSLLFTAYAADEGDSILFKSDQKSITYLLSLLSKSTRMKFCRAKGLSTEELAKGIEKLSKNDENKQLLVDLGILPILKILMENNSLKYKEISLSILWSLAFDERNREVINKTFSSLLYDMKSYLDKPEENKVEGDFSEEEKYQDNEDEFLTGSIIGNVSKKDEKTNQSRNNSPFKRSINVKVSEDPSMMRNEDESSLMFRSEDVICTERAVEKSNCSKTLNGLAWTLQGEHKSQMKVGLSIQESLIKRKKNDEHLMISYCWDNTEIVMKIYEALRNLGYKLWIDKYNMAEKENLMESMAIAVENSKAVILCISSCYKDSQNCRAEAQYAVTKKKPLIPVIVQQKYRPDGWLGLCISGLMYCDFKGSRTFEESMEGLSKQLKRIASVNENEVNTTDHIIAVVTPSEKKEPQTTSDVLQWKHSEVIEWLKNIGIKKVTWKDHYDGQELYFFKTLSEDSLETFFRISETSLGLTDIKDLRLFYHNIRKI